MVRSEQMAAVLQRALQTHRLRRLGDGKTCNSWGCEPGRGLAAHYRPAGRLSRAISHRELEIRQGNATANKSQRFN